MTADGRSPDPDPDPAPAGPTADAPDRERLRDLIDDIARPAPRPAYGDERDALPDVARMRTNRGYEDLPLAERTTWERAGTADKSHRVRLLAAERSAEILQKRIDGWTIRQLAKHYKVGQGTIHKILVREYDKAARKAAESAEHLRVLHHERMEDMYRALLPQIHLGNARSIEMALRLLERQAKLSGLDAPERREVDVTVSGLTDADLVRQAEMLDLPVPPSLRHLADGGDVIDGEIVPPDALTDKDPHAHPEGGPPGPAPAPAPPEAPPEA